MKSFERFFLWDPEGDGFETFATEAEMLAAAKGAIADCCDDDGWDEDMGQMVCGRITHSAQKTNVRTRQPGPDGWIDEDGNEWPNSECAEYCDYEMQPIDGDDDEEKAPVCEGCLAPATTADCEGVPLCAGCYGDLVADGKAALADEEDPS